MRSFKEFARDFGFNLKDKDERAAAREAYVQWLEAAGYAAFAKAMFN